MYKLFSLLIFTISYLSLKGQCPSGDITLTSQAQIDNFKQNYPNCTNYSGELGINNLVPFVLNSDITNLDSLNELESIAGLDIIYCQNLTSIEGLQNLNTINGSIVLFNNPEIEDLAPLSDITTANQLLIREMDGLSDLTGFDNLTSLSSYIFIFDNQNLTSLDGLQGLQSIDGYIVIRQNPSLIDISGIVNIAPSSISSSSSNVEDLEIHNNGSLSDCAIENICQFIESSNITTEIHSNISPCNSQAEIEMECENNQPPECTILVSPTNGQSNVDIDADIVWQSTDNADGYIINVGTTSGGNDIINNLDVPQNVTVLDLGTLPYLTIIFVNITPYNSNGNALNCIEEIFLTQDIPPIPECTQMTVPTNGGIDVSVFTQIMWNSVPDADFYYVILETQPGSGDLIDSVNVGNTTILNYQLPFEQTLYFKVYPGNESGVAADCQVFNFTTEDYPICPYGTVLNFNSQESIDNFGINYPNCTTLNNKSIVVEEIGIGNITNLEGFNAIEQVNGNINILNTSILDLQGLSNLNGVLFGGNDGTANGIVIQNNPSLTSLTGLEGLQTVTSINLNNNDNLTSIESLSNVSNLIGTISILNNQILESIDGIPALSGSSVTISLNSNLSFCAVDQLCDYIEMGGVPQINNNSTGCNSYTEVETACSILPVTYSKELQAYQQNQDIILEFSVAQQINNSYFEIQHSTDSQEFYRIGIIKGETNTNQERAYDFIHSYPKDGNNYYRIKQVDLDGRFSLSLISSVLLKKDVPPLVYPNPTNENLYSTFSEKTEIRVYSLNGELVLQDNLDHDGINISSLEKGVYFYSLAGVRGKLVIID